MYNKNQKYFNTNIFYIAIGLSLLSYFGIYLLNDYRAQMMNYFITILPAYIGYLIFVFYSLKFKKIYQYHFILIVIIAILSRLALIFTDPILSDDIYRYLWDGKVLSHGINPFAYAPDSIFLKNLQDNTIFPFINFPDIPTVYPPVAQIIFAVSYFIGYNLIVWKLILLLFEFILVLYLIKLIDHFKMNKMRLSIFLLNPIVIIETYSSGHLDIIAVCFLFIGIYFFYINKTWASILTFLFSILIKYKPLLIIIPFLKKRFMLKISLVLGSVLIVLIPFAKTGVIPTAGIVSYANRWEFNGFLYKIFLFIFDISGFESQKWFSFFYNGRTEDFFISAALFYKITAFIIILIILIDQFKKLNLTANFKGVNYLQASFFICAAMLLLSPTLYPWYLIWIIPFLIFLPNWSWIFFTSLIQLSYYVLQSYKTQGIWEESTLILFLQYLPFYGLLIFEYIDKRKIKGWFL